MTVLSAQGIRWYVEQTKMIEPFHERTRLHGLTFGLSSCGYDVRIAEDLCIDANEFVLASTIEQFKMPKHIMGIVHDKSTWARRGLCVQNTVIEPGWRGDALTLELTNHGPTPIYTKRFMPIAQIVFHLLDEPTEQIYEGKYQDQKAGPQPALDDPTDFEANGEEI